MNLRTQKLRRNVTALCVLFLVLTAGTWAGAQEMLQPPMGFGSPGPAFVPPPPLGYPITCTGGVFYFNAGAKYRNVQSVSVRTLNSTTQALADPGAPAYGPNFPGFASYPAVTPGVLPSGDPTQPPNGSGVWLYDDGFVEPTGNNFGAVPPVPGQGYPSGATSGLGHLSGGANTGSFRIFDRTQATPPDAATYQSATALTFRKLLTGLTPVSAGPGGLELVWGGAIGPQPGSPYFEEVASIGARINTRDGERDFETNIWAPYLELGYRYTNFFDAVLGLSWFSLGRSFAVTRNNVATLIRRGYADTYAFQSSDTAAFTISNPWSADPPAADQTYLIFPNGDTSAGLAPVTRSFFIAEDTSVPPFAVNQTISSRLDVTPLEFKLGGRSWVPLYGIGQFGASTGLLLTPMSYKATSTTSAVATQDVIIPGPIGQPPITVVTAGQTVLSTVDSRTGNWFGFGMYGGLDLQAEMRNFFARSTLEYDWYFYSNMVDVGVIENKLNLSGVSGIFTLGCRF